MSLSVRQAGVGALTLAGAVLVAGIGTRIPMPANDDLADVAAAFNLMSERLGEAFSRLKAMESDRRNLVASVSHDLRTPLASIRAMQEAMQDGIVTDPQTVASYH